jgi:hypothetical protein
MRYRHLTEGERYRIAVPYKGHRAIGKRLGLDRVSRRSAGRAAADDFGLAVSCGKTLGLLAAGDALPMRAA